MSSPFNFPGIHLVCLVFSGLGFFSQVTAVNEDDLGLSSFPRAYDSLDEKSVYHQNRLRGMKRDFNDYGGRVYDLRRRFDLIFKNRETDMAPPVPFEIGDAAAFRDRQTQSRVTYQDPSFPARIHPRDPPVSQPPTEVIPEPGEEKSPLAFVVEGPGQAPEAQVQDEVENDPEKDVARRKLKYYILPRFGISLPSDDDYESGLSLAVGGGFTRGDWRLGVDFSYSSNDFSRSREVLGFTHAESGDLASYALLVNVNRDIPLGANWVGSVSLGIGGGWSHSDSTLYVTPPIPWEEREGGFAWQVGLGARRLFGEASAVFLGYRYLEHPAIGTHNFEAGAEIGF